MYLNVCLKEEEKSLAKWILQMKLLQTMVFSEALVGLYSPFEHNNRIN